MSEERTYLELSEEGEEQVEIAHKVHDEYEAEHNDG